ncbi:YbhB/YbcL family Raf kinase inhibitor-like protein [Enterovirga sp.]|jgi:Raf kinase inhibitor-like YbhB/YbcL family protein|uniref:YbhB/YbcL family Raf kinase inhibitor-like protein n=1 Tax=Enterovirga sp. TaxID=2026350 RepID=UPI002602792A|nr:YbhB/YbcL family Raf kinase inhibitor-like protein [Enterovirga sp.]MDB5590956.1 phosphatidylethanolamine-binding protein [Enterovirga sp.]
MLEKLPHAVGEALRGFKPGLERTIYHSDEMAQVPETIIVTSDSFGDGAPIPERYTEDGQGISPPLGWAGAPAGTAAFVLVIEDADSPTPSPLVHAIVWNLHGDEKVLPEGALPSDADPGDDTAMGKNSYLEPEYLPPDPPPGHGPHRYLFQVYALSEPLELGGHPGRGKLLAAMRGRVMGRGVLTGTYHRP